MKRLRSKRVVVLFAGVALLLGAGLALAATKRERSEAVYPPQRIPLIFSHEQHFLADVDECEACHEGVGKSVRATDLLMPAHPQCDSCHEIEAAAKGKVVDPKSACEDCHKGYDKQVQKDPARALFPTANLLFNHRVHKEKKVACVTCHNSTVTGTMREVGLATRLQLPKMETCLECHDGKTASAACATCHVTDKTGRIAQQFASGTLRPIQGDPFGVDHGPRFEFNHGTRAKIDRGICMECHTEGSCAQCHDGLQKPLSVHPNDYITLHPIQARMDSLRCEGCHRYQSFCASCHERVGIGMDADPSLRARNVRVHPDYATWVDLFGPNHHAIAATRDIKSCMACHREESCMGCHATSAVVSTSRGTNPHPGNFKAGCRAMASNNDRACLKCHTAADLTAKGCK
ncbi:MAG: cytochrome [Myxococcaceae bacterium]|nr:cytochrome [Myxococcaceae bacterium]